MPDVVEEKHIRLDIGCGTNKRKDGEWIGVDTIDFPDVDVVSDALTYLKTLEDNSVEEMFASHFLEHLNGEDRVLFMNEAWRVLQDKAKFTIVCPHWSHERAYGDPTHKWPPVNSWTFYYMNKGWRDVNAPHCGYTCDFDFGVAGSFDPNDSYVANRNIETKMIFMSRNINVTTDIIATLNKKAAVI